MEKRDHTRIYGLLRRLGHTGTEDEIAERIMAVAPRAGVRANALAEDFPCSAPPASAEWRQNRAEVISYIVSCITRVGRVACIMPDAGAVPSGSDGDGAAEDPDEDATSEPVAEVVAAVRNCDWQGRIDAVEDILSYVKSEVGEVVAAVKELQEDESADVRLHAFYALCLRDMALQTFCNISSYADAALVPDLLGILTDPASDNYSRYMATRALGFCGADAEAAVPALARGLTDEDQFVRERSAAALMAIGPAAKEAVPALLEALPALRDNAVQALGSIGPAAKEAVPTLLEALPALRGSAFEALKSIGAATEAIAPVLVGMTKGEDRSARRFAARALVEIGAETDVAVAALIDSLNDGISSTRYVAARTLGEIGPRAKSAVPVLSAALEDDNKIVRKAAKAALERIVPVAAG